MTMRRLMANFSMMCDDEQVAVVAHERVVDVRLRDAAAREQHEVARPSARCQSSMCSMQL